MSVTIPSSLSRILQNWQQSTPVAPQAPQGPAPVSSPAAAPRGYSTADGFEQASAKQQEWAAKFAASPTGVIQQTTDNNCGAAAAVIATGSKGNTAQRMAELDSTFTDGKGTTPEQLGNMLAHEGMAVKQAAFKYDQNTVDTALSNGGKLMVQVDSNQIAPGANKQQDGREHWVVIDGKDAQGNYTVKDPGTGSSYAVDFNTLTSAVDNGWWKHNGGGMLIVEEAKGGLSGAALAQANAQQIVPLAKTPGGGSRAETAFGRESS